MWGKWCGKQRREILPVDQKRLHLGNNVWAGPWWSLLKVQNQWKQNSNQDNGSRSKIVEVSYGWEVWPVWFQAAWELSISSPGRKAQFSVNTQEVSIILYSDKDDKPTLYKAIFFFFSLNPVARYLFKTVLILSESFTEMTRFQYQIPTCSSLFFFFQYCLK